MPATTDIIEVRPEDRIALRRAVHVSAHISAIAEGPVAGTVTDLSVHGLWVAAGQPLTLGADVVISFVPPHHENELALDATIVRVGAHGGDETEVGMGLSFVALSPEAQEILEDSLKGLPPRRSRDSAPVIAAVTHDPLENEVEQIIDDEDMRDIEESGIHAIVVDEDSALEDDEFAPLRDSELELFAIG